MTFQKEIIIGPYKRGFHIITNKIVNELPVMSGIVNVFIKHTSASLTINENADPSVRDDFETHFNIMVPEDGDHFIYPDCRPEFLRSMNTAAELCDPSKISVKAPFINLNKGEILKIGLDLNIDYSKTWTCYKGLEKACGKCE